MNDFGTEQPMLLNLPASVRTYLYDKIFPYGYTIYISLEMRTSLGPWTKFLRTCRQIHAELTEYLSSKSIILLCTAGQRPNILHAIPRSILPKVEVVVIEDSPDQYLVLGFLPGLKCICFCEIWRSKYLIPLGYGSGVPVGSSLEQTEQITDASTNNQPPASSIEQARISPAHTSPQISATVTTPATTLPNRSQLLPLPSNNATLGAAHHSWKTLRIDHSWIREIWKERTDIRIVLRRVDEMELNFDPSLVKFPATATSTEDIVYSRHSVVDVSTRSIIEKRYLPTHPKLTKDEDATFEYGAQNWWKLESGWRRSERAEA